MICLALSAYCLDARKRIAVVPITETASPRDNEERLERRCSNPDCGETTLRDTICRDCDIEDLLARSSCQECGIFVMRAELFPPGTRQHAPGCSKEPVTS